MAINQAIRRRRERIAADPRVGDVLIVQQPAGKYWPGQRGQDIWERIEVIGVFPYDCGRPLDQDTQTVRVRVSFPRAPKGSMWRWGGYETVRFAGAWWMSWPGVVRRAQATAD